MPASTNKKVLVARFEKAALPGFVQMPGGLTSDGLEMLTPEGAILKLPFSEVKAVCFVRDFESGESWREHRSFATRPKTAGLWLVLRFRDGDSVEGIVANNLMLLEPLGFSIIPPDPTFQNHRIFVPRAALSEVQVLGVIGSPLRRRKPATKAASKMEEDQIEMFE